MTHRYDIVVIGAGSGGLTAAVGAARIGKRVLLIEKEHMGGECTNTGCIPSKALLHHAKTYRSAHNIAGDSTQGEAYRTGAMAYVRSKRDQILAGETPETFRNMGIDVVLGEAIFKSRCAVQVGEHSYEYGRAIVATGSSPRMLEVKGLASEHVLTNQNIFELETIPEKLLVIGSGPIGMEMGQACAMLGSDVTIATIDKRIAKLEDDAIASIIQTSFEELGVHILLNAHIQNVTDRTAHFVIKNDATVMGEEAVLFDKVLVAIGRVPNLPQGLDVAGIKADSRCILVDSQYRTSNKYVYALGDVSQMLKFTHTADDTARQVITRIASKGWLRVHNKKAVPKVTYTDPEIAAVGLSYSQACKKYDCAEIMRIEVPFTDSDRAQTDSATNGLMVATVRRINGAILGANIIGPRAGELISIFTLAIDNKISMWRLRRTIYAYPTYALLIKKAGDIFFAQQLSTLKRDVRALVGKHMPKLIALIFWGALLWFFTDYRTDRGLGYGETIAMLFAFFSSTMYGPFAYVVLYAIRPLIFFPATLLTALSGALFGPVYGILYTVLGENASANFAYWIGRFFGKNLMLEDTFLGGWITSLNKRPFESVLFMRLFYVPFDLTNYGSGVLGVPWISYFLATLIGIMPGLTVFVLLGSSLSAEEIMKNGISFDAFNPFFFGLSILIFVASIVFARFLRRWKPRADEENK